MFALGFNEATQPLDLQLWPHHPRRNQGGPFQRTWKHITI